MSFLNAVTYSQYRRSAAGPSLCAALAASLVASPSPASAQACGAAWTDPVVCEVRVGVVAPGDRVQELVDDRPISVPAGKSVRLQVQATDQFGYAFPDDRLLSQLEVDRRCAQLISIENEGEGRFSIAAGSERGICRLFLWIPGNLNLEWPLDVEVVSPVADGYSREQAELIATRLYRAILGRDPEPAGLQSTTAEILRDRLDNAVAGMYQSSEFTTRRSRLAPMEQLEELYLELLGRELDAAGIRSHLTDMEQRRYIEVALRIARSEEFEQHLVEEAGP